MSACAEREGRHGQATTTHRWSLRRTASCCLRQYSSRAVACAAAADCWMPKKGYGREFRCCPQRRPSSLPECRTARQARTQDRPQAHPHPSTHPRPPSTSPQAVRSAARAAEGPTRSARRTAPSTRDRPRLAAGRSPAVRTHLAATLTSSRTRRASHLAEEGAARRRGDRAREGTA